MSKIIKKFDAATIRSAVNRIAEPVIQTLTPLGNNVLFEKDLFSVITNDGATIAKLIDSEDEVEDAIIQMVKYGSLATNKQAGDGTSTTILLTKQIVDQGLERIEAGDKPMLLKQQLTKLKDDILTKAEELKTEVNQDNWQEIALISSGGDEELSKNVVDIIDTAGLDGMVFINESKSGKTKIIKDTGYNINQQMLDPVLGNRGNGQADYSKPHVFITDKKLYHIEECREILERAFEYGVSDIVIVAKDFVGEAPGFLVFNHTSEEVPLRILLVKYPLKDNDSTPLYDLATYLGGEVVTEKIGNLKGKLTADHYVLADRVYSAMDKTVFVTDKKANPELTSLVEEVRKLKEDNPDDTKAAERLASLTAGTVNLEIGASTGPEMRELMYRYEDAINAVRSSIRSGFVTGGGLTLLDATRGLGEFAERLGEASVKQIAHNCGISYQPENYLGDTGYNAKTGKFSNLRDDGVIEPFDVFKYSLSNAISIANAILTSGYYVVNKVKKEKK
jgi:chaperonin GroEL